MSQDPPRDPDRRPHHHPETLAVHAGRSVDPETGAVAPALHSSTTFERDPDGAYSRGHIYARNSNPTRARLEECLAALEDGAGAWSFSSGSAATSAVLQCLEPGMHVVVTEDAYHGTRHLLDTLFRRWGIRHDRVDTSDTDAVASALRPETRLLWIESPSNPLQRVADLEALAELAAEREVVTVCDNTLASPVRQNPLRHGIDLVVHSTTKYLGGHSDLLGGAVIGREHGPWHDELAEIQATAGAISSPRDDWLLLRSLATLPVRVERQAGTAGALAEWLAGHPAVAEVFHPALEDHPQRERVARYLPGGTGLLALRMKGGETAAWKLVQGVRLFTRATSLGGVESLIEHRASIEDAATRTPPDLVRISVGLEHPEDLLGDLKQALAHCPTAPGQPQSDNPQDGGRA